MDWDWFKNDPCPAPGESIYFWMYRQGLRGIPYTIVLKEVLEHGHDVRKKDEENFKRGCHKHNMNTGDPMGLLNIGWATDPIPDVFTTEYSDYPEHPRAGKPELEDRFIYVREDGVIPYKWGDPSNRMTWSTALSNYACATLAENLKGTQQIVIDCDGDHGNQIDLETIEFFRKYSDITQTFTKPKQVREYGVDVNFTEQLDWYPSFHLTFHVDRVIPTRHFIKAHVDLLGNKENQVRYFKNKFCNNLPVADMTDEIWREIMNYLEWRET